MIRAMEISGTPHHYGKAGSARLASDPSGLKLQRSQQAPGRPELVRPAAERPGAHRNTVARLFPIACAWQIPPRAVVICWSAQAEEPTPVLRTAAHGAHSQRRAPRNENREQDENVAASRERLTERRAPGCRTCQTRCLERMVARIRSQAGHRIRFPRPLALESGTWVHKSHFLRCSGHTGSICNRSLQKRRGGGGGSAVARASVRERQHHQEHYHTRQRLAWGCRAYDSGLPAIRILLPPSLRDSRSLDCGSAEGCTMEMSTHRIGMALCRRSPAALGGFPRGVSLFSLGWLPG